jgi:hypothetical protein
MLDCQNRILRLTLDFANNEQADVGGMQQHNRMNLEIVV